MSRTKGFYSMIAVLGLFLLLPNNSAEAFNISLTIKFGVRPDCRMRGGFCEIIISLDLRTADGTGGGNAEGELDGNQLRVHMLEPIPADQLEKELEKGMPLLNVPDDFQLTLSPEVAQKLRRDKNLIIMKGKYRVDFAHNKFGDFMLNLKQMRESPSKGSLRK